MKAILTIFILIASNFALAEFVEVAKINRQCPYNVILKQRGEYFFVRTAGCFLVEGLEGESTPSLSLMGTARIKFSDGHMCAVALVYDSSLFLPHDDDMVCR